MGQRNLTGKERIPFFIAKLQFPVQRSFEVWALDIQMIEIQRTAILCQFPAIPGCIALNLNVARVFGIFLVHDGCCRKGCLCPCKLNLSLNL